MKTTADIVRELCDLADLRVDQVQSIDIQVSSVTFHALALNADGRKHVEHSTGDVARTTVTLPIEWAPLSRRKRVVRWLRKPPPLFFIGWTTACAGIAWVCAAIAWTR